jgi:hypothetical protein
MPSSQNAEPDDFAAQWMRPRMGAIALHGLEQIDSRSAALFQSWGLLRGASPPSLPADTAALISDDRESRRVPSSYGPFVFVQEDEKRRSVIDAVDMLTYSRSDVRAAALVHIMRGSPNNDCMLESTSDRLRKFSTEIESDDPSRWRRPAAAAADMLRDDFLFAVNGLSQSLRMEFTEGFNHYLPHVLRPLPRTLQRITLDIWEPENELERISSMIDSWVDGASTVSEACTKYYRALGYLPLAGVHSIVSVVERWLVGHPETGSPWESVWEWAEKFPSPVTRYHACLIFICRPDFVPPTERQRLWSEILNVVHQKRPITDEEPSTSSERQSLRWTDAWSLRASLAAHYTSWLESTASSLSGERVSNAAWWMSERLSSALGDSPGTLAWFRETVVDQSLNGSRLVSQLAAPTIAPSPLRTATRLSGAPWARAIVAALGESAMLGSSAGLAVADRERLTAAIIAALLDFSTGTGSEKSAIYAFERSPIPAANWWRGAIEDVQAKEHVDAFILVRDLAEQPVTSLLETMTADNSSMRSIAIASLRSQASSGRIDAEALFGALGDAERRAKLFAVQDESVLEALCDIVGELQTRMCGKMCVEFPHFFASAAESASAHRRETLFAFTVGSSASAGTVSAIDRLLRGRERRTFHTAADAWRLAIARFLPHVTPWAAGRLRALSAALRID